MQFLTCCAISFVTLTNAAVIDDFEYQAHSKIIHLTVTFCRKINDVWPIISYIGEPCRIESESDPIPQCHITVMVHNETMDCQENGVIVEHKAALYRISSFIPYPSNLIFHTSDGSRKIISLN